jgi:hypothetical protein
MDRRMSRRRKVYEGKAKVLFEGPEPGTLIDISGRYTTTKQGIVPARACSTGSQVSCCGWRDRHSASKSAG